MKKKKIDVAINDDGSDRQFAKNNHNCKLCILAIRDVAFAPVRYIRVARGKYVGDHAIYISEEVFRQHNPDYKKPIPRNYWEAEIGDWVYTDDSYVIQVLDKYRLTNRHYDTETIKDNRGKTDILVFCNKYTRVYYRSDGTINAHRFLGCYIPIVKDKINDQNYNPLGAYMGEKKKHFILLLANKMRPDLAYMQAYNVKYSLARSKGYRLAMADDDVIRELTKFMRNSLLEDLSKFGLDGDYVLKGLKEMIDDPDTKDNVRAGLLTGLLKIHYGLQQRILPTAGEVAEGDGMVEVNTRSVSKQESKAKLMSRISDATTEDL